MSPHAALHRRRDRKWKHTCNGERVEYVKVRETLAVLKTLLQQHAPPGIRHTSTSFQEEHCRPSIFSCVDRRGREEREGEGEGESEAQFEGTTTTEAIRRSSIHFAARGPHYYTSFVRAQPEIVGADRLI